MSNPLTGPIVAYASRLRFPHLFLFTLALFILDVLIPDVIPFADEILLGLATLMLSRWKRAADPKPPIEVEPK
jgi:hypothetical protein